MNNQSYFRAQPIHDVLLAFLRQNGLETPLLEYRITQAWTEVMGDTIWVHNTTMEEVENLLAVVATYRNEQMDTTAMFKYQPAGITREQFKTFIERMNNTRLFDVDGIERENMIHTDTLQRAKNKIAEAEQMAVAKGYTSVEEWWSGALDEAYKKLTEQKSSVCSSISLQIKQTKAAQNV